MWSAKRNISKTYVMRKSKLDKTYVKRKGKCLQSGCVTWVGKAIVKIVNPRKKKHQTSFLNVRSLFDQHWLKRGSGWKNRKTVLSYMQSIDDTVSPERNCYQTDTMQTLIHVNHVVAHSFSYSRPGKESVATCSKVQVIFKWGNASVNFTLWWVFAEKQRKLGCLHRACGNPKAHMSKLKRHVI